MNLCYQRAAAQVCGKFEDNSVSVLTDSSFQVSWREHISLLLQARSRYIHGIVAKARVFEYGEKTSKSRK